MKRPVLLILAFMIVLSFFAVIPAASQESDMYYINVPILKIFPHRQGYYVIYRRSGLKTGEAYVPKTWLDRRDQRAIMNLYTGDIAPYMTIVLKEGEFNHVRVVVPKNLKHPVWGVMGMREDLDPKFEVEKLDIKF